MIKKEKNILYAHMHTECDFLVLCAAEELENADIKLLPHSIYEEFHLHLHAPSCLVLCTVWVHFYH